MNRGLRQLTFLLLLTIASAAIAQEAQVYAPLVEANTRFAFKFFRQSLAESPEGNLLTAPVSLSTDFAFLQNGADKTTHQEIGNVFETNDLSPQQINEQSLALRHALSYTALSSSKSRPSPRRKGPTPPPLLGDDSPDHLFLAGSLWARPAVALRPAFVETAKKVYRFQILSASQTQPVNTVNAWVARQTGGTISDAIKSWEGDDFLLIDTTWFKGAWTRPFLPRDTHTAGFNLLTGQTKPVQMMTQTGEFNYLRGPKFQAVCLHYYRAAMYVFLPDEDSTLKEFEESLTADTWQEWTTNFGYLQGHLELPRFQLEYRSNVTKTLISMGLVRAFTSFGAFRPAVENPEGAELTRVLQIILLKVDEKGTEVSSAGVVGGVIGGISAGPRPQPFRMIVNRPFFFAIRDNRTQEILYMGTIVNPTDASQ